MNNPVSFEIAKLLKEKRFKTNVKNLIYNELGELLDSIDQLNLMKEEESLQDYFKLIKSFPNAPKIAEVIMWLYETHKIWISVDRHFDKFISKNNGVIINFYGNRESYFDTPKEAYSSAIQYVLNKII